MSLRGIRGATTVDHPDGKHQDARSILFATRELLLAICEANPTLRPADIASVFFTVTEELHAAYPAQAAREMGWEDVPLMDAQEIPVPGSVPNCIRVLIHWNTSLPQKEIHHVYLHDAGQLRPDLVRASQT